MLGRRLAAKESEQFLEVLTSTRVRFSEDPAAAKEFVSVGQSPRDETLGLAEHATWAALCLAVLNLDETINKP